MDDATELFREIYRPIIEGIEFIEGYLEVSIKITQDPKDSMFYYNHKEVMVWVK